MALENLYFEIKSRRFVRSHEEPQAVAPPVFGHGDTRDFGVTFLKRVSQSSFQVIQSIVSVQVGISATTAPNTILTSYTAGAAENNEHPFLLNCASPLDSFMSSETEEKEAIGQFRIVTTNGENRYPFTIYIAPKQLTATTVDSTADDPGLRKSEAGALYMPKEVPVGTRWIWTDEVTGQQYAVGFANGQFQPNLM